MQKPSSRKFSSYQLFITLIATIVGVGFLTLPRVVTAEVGRDGWLAIVMGGIIALLFVTLTIYLASLYPQEDPTTYIYKVYGRMLGKVILLGLSLYFLVFSSLVNRSISELIKLYLLELTPLEIILLIVLFTVAYLIQHGLHPIIRSNEIFVLVIMGTVFLIFLLSQQNVDYARVQPVFARGIFPIVQTVPDTLFSYWGFSIILFIYPHLANKPKAYIAGGLGILLVMSIYLVGTIIVIATFGDRVTALMMYPLIDLAESVEFAGGFIERFELVLTAGWMIAGFTTITAYFYMGVVSLRGALGLKTHYPLTYLVLPFVFILSLLPQNIAQLLTWQDALGFSGLAIILLLLPSTIVLTKFKKGGK